MIGLVLFIIGGILIAFALHSMYEVSAMRDTLSHHTTTLFHKIWDPIYKFFGGKPSGAVTPSNTMNALKLVAGLILVVVGAVFGYLSKDRKHWWH